MNWVWSLCCLGFGIGAIITAVQSFSAAAAVWRGKATATATIEGETFASPVPVGPTMLVLNGVVRFGVAVVFLFFAAFLWTH